jgi:hypothetical protein
MSFHSFIAFFVIYRALIAAWEISDVSVHREGENPDIHREARAHMCAVCSDLEGRGVGAHLWEAPVERRQLRYTPQPTHRLRTRGEPGTCLQLVI